MFEQIQPEWGSHFSLRAAILNAIGSGFAAGMALAVLIVEVLRFRATYLEIGTVVFSLVLAVALAIRFYFVAMSKARAQSPPSLD